jgi:hypothetical protein
MKYNKYISIILLSLCFNCTEEFNIKNEDFENYLVIEGKITDQLKTQEITLSTVIPLTATEPVFVTNYNVVVLDNLGNSYNFQHFENGLYKSITEFKALPNINYKLNVTSNTGIVYESKTMVLPDLSILNNVYTEIVDNEYLQVFADGSSSSNGQYFRYEYEETYKIVAPFHADFDATIANLVIIPTGWDAGTYEFDVIITPREQEERTCFITQKSKNILLAQTDNLSDNEVKRIPIRKIEFDDSIIKERYSILVRQFSQSIEAYTFYQTLKDLGDFGSLLSSTQPGFINGNINTSNESEKVIGFFDVVTEQEQRIYLNYFDFLLPEPPYFFECENLTLDYTDNEHPGPPGDGDINERRLLFAKVNEFNYKYVDGVFPIYDIVNPECGDCTTLGSNIQPEFWEE